MAVTQYIGARYVPNFASPIEWNNTRTYDPLTIVTHQGNSYTSRQFVPQGVDIANDTFWALTGNYNAQVEQYRRETAELSIAVAKSAMEFDTVADMQAYQSLKPGVYCHTLGFHNRDDGGSAYYVIEETGTADGSTVIGIPANDKPILFATLIKVQTFATPEMYGAVGDGVHNDTMSMNACFGDNEVIVMPIGKNYFVDYIDIVKKNTHIYGNNSTLKFNSHRQGNIGDTVNIHKSELLSNRLAYKNDSNIQMGSFIVENLNVNGNSGYFTNYSDYSNTYNMFMCIQLYNYENVVIKNCKFFNTIQDAVHLHNANSIVITNNTFENIANGERVKNMKGSANALTVSGLLNSRAVISNNTFEFVWNECARIDDYSSVEFTNNIINHCYQYGLEIFIHNAYEERIFVISNNNVNELRDTFVHLDASQSVASNANFYVENNKVKGIGAKTFAAENVPIKLYEGSFINAPLENGDLVFYVNSNDVSIENYEINSSSSAINVRYNSAFVIKNVFDIQKPYTHPFSANYLVFKENQVTCNPNIRIVNGCFRVNECKMESNKITANAASLLYYPSQSSRDLIVITDNDIAIGINDKIIDTDATKPYKIVIFTNNRVKDATLFSDSGTITNLVSVGNVLPINFRIPSNMSVTNKLEHNLVTL